MNSSNVERWTEVYRHFSRSFSHSYLLRTPISNVLRLYIFELKKKKKEKKTLENLKPSFHTNPYFLSISFIHLLPFFFLFPFKTWQILLKVSSVTLHLVFLSRIAPLFTREKFKKLKCISWFFFFPLIFLF